MQVDLVNIDESDIYGYTSNQKHYFWYAFMHKRSLHLAVVMAIIIASCHLVKYHISYIMMVMVEI